MLKKVDQLCKDVFHRMIYGPSQEEEHMIKDIWLKNRINYHILQKMVVIWEKRESNCMNNSIKQ